MSLMIEFELGLVLYRRQLSQPRLNNFTWQGSNYGYKVRKPYNYSDRVIIDTFHLEAGRYSQETSRIKVNEQPSD